MKYYAGIDLGGTNIAVAVVDENSNIVKEISIPTLAPRKFEDIVSDMAKTVEKVVLLAGLTIDNIEHIGMGVPSNIDPNNNNVIFANNLDWRNKDVLGEFKKHIDSQLYIQNDADCAAYAEYLVGAGKDYNCLVMFTLGTGVGGGIIMNNKIFRGCDGFGCEPGHMIIDMDGLDCTCGQKGCLETYASEFALKREIKAAIKRNPNCLMAKTVKKNPNKLNGKLAFDCAQNGDKEAELIVNGFIHSLAIGISSFITTFRPQAVIVGGGISQQGEKLLKPLRDEIYKTVYAYQLTPKTPIIAAKLGNKAGIIGAALLGLQS